MGNSKIIVIIRWKKSICILFCSSMLLDIQEITSLWKPAVVNNWDINRLTFSEGSFESQCLSSHDFTFFIFSLHFVLQTQCKEIINCLLKHIFVLKLPQPIIQASSKLLPFALIFFCNTPRVKKNWNLYKTKMYS